MRHRHLFQERGLPELVRASVHYYNTGDELAALCQVVEGLAR
jgi:selenocysteine lyase/cysteine desulfurase